ncbi:type II toxin-antitoxin system VapC family toxin [Candidatus Poribacteria bacterium]|nr:type II toxin-antitoxin system VapC family toxin [Candidatus Poribacteria bacterium]
MKMLLDTSVLVAAMVESHPMHERAFPWLQRIKDGTDVGLVAAHSIAELYAILTTLPVQPRISPAISKPLIRHNVLEICEVVSLSGEDDAAIIEHLSEASIVGGVTYDALILYVALKVDVDYVITLNEKDFRRIYPNLADKVISP